MSKEVDTSPIDDDAQKTPKSSIEEKEKALDSGLEKIELLIGDLNRISEFTNKATDFADQAKTEIKWNRWSRVVVLGAVAVLLVGFVFIAYKLTQDASFVDLRKNPTAFAATLASVVGGGTLLAGTVTKSVFLSFKNRNEGLPIPKHFKEVIDSVNALTGK